jgi:hypothetical protein
MHSQNGSTTVDSELDAATTAAHKKLKTLNKEMNSARNAAQRAEVSADMDAVKAEWFIEFGRAVIRSGK